MSQRQKGLYRLLYYPKFYQWFQNLLGETNFVRVVVDSLLRPNPGDRLLDVGCGTGSLLEHLPNVDYTGIDINPKYIEHAKDNFGKRGAFITGDIATIQNQIDTNHRFQIITLICITHHLPDQTVIDLFREIKNLLAKGGRLCIVDPCFHPEQSSIARYLAQKDRGVHVRQAGEYERLTKIVFPNVHTKIHKNILRIPYSHVFLEASC